MMRSFLRDTLTGAVIFGVSHVIGRLIRRATEPPAEISERAAAAILDLVQLDAELRDLARPECSCSRCQGNVIPEWSGV